MYVLLLLHMYPNNLAFIMSLLYETVFIVAAVI